MNTLNMHQFSITYIFFFNDTATTEIYTLSLHDALPIFAGEQALPVEALGNECRAGERRPRLLVGHLEEEQDRKSTRLNSSHVAISYAVFCLKKKKKIQSKQKKQNKKIK